LVSMLVYQRVETANMTDDVLIHLNVWLMIEVLQGASI
jgi:hypothetical protein